MKVVSQRTHELLVVGMLAVLGLACNGQPPSQNIAGDMTDAERQAVITEVKTEAEAFFASTRSLDGAGVMAHFDSTETVYVVNAHEYSFETLKTDLADGFLGTLASWEGNWVQTQVWPLTPDAAVFHGTFDVRQTLRAGGTRTISGGHFTALYRRRDGAWRMTHAHMSYVAH